MQSSFKEGWGKFFKENSVGGHGQVFDGGDPGELVDELDSILTHQRLTPGDTDFGNAFFRSQRGQTVDFLVAEDFRMAERRDPLLGHAVLTTEVATIRNGDSQVINPPVMGVYEGAHLRKDRGKERGFRKNRSGEVDLPEFLKKAGQQGIASILVEGGKEIFTSFLKERLVDKFYYFLSPKIIGEGLDTFGDLKIERIKDSLKLKAITLKKFSKDYLLVGYPDWRN